MLALSAAVILLLCGSAVSARAEDDDHGTHSAEDGWTAISGTVTVASLVNGGKYYLTGDVTLGAAKTIGASTEITICLNGHTLTAADNARAFVLTQPTSKLTIEDCQGNHGALQGNAGGGANGTVIFAQKGNVELTNITVKYTGTANTASGGAIRIGNSATAMAALTMTGCTVTGGFSGASSNANNGGGNLYVGPGSSATIKNSVIKDGTVTISGTGKAGGGGNILIREDSTVTLENCTVQNGNATNGYGGGNIYITGAATLTLKNCTLSDGSAAADNSGNLRQANENTSITLEDTTLTGGGCYISNAETVLTLKGKVVISGGTDYNVRWPVRVDGTGNMITIDGTLSEGSDVGVFATNPGAFAATAVETNKAFFTLDDAASGYRLSYESGTLKKEEIKDVQLALTDNLSVKFYVVVDTETYPNAKLSATMNGETKEIDLPAAKESNGTYCFVYDGVTPKQIGDVITVSVVNGEETVKEVFTEDDALSVASYLNRLKAGTASELGISDAKKAALDTLVDDLLAYGYQSAQFFNYQTSLDESTATRTLPEDTAGLIDLTGNSAGASAYFAGANVIHRNANALMFRYAGSEAGSAALEGIEAQETTAAGSLYTVISAPLKASEYGKVYTVKLTVSGTTTATVKYSLYAYAVRMAGSESANKEFYKALYSYGKSAEVYASQA